MREGGKSIPTRSQIADYSQNKFLGRLKQRSRETLRGVRNSVHQRSWKYVLLLSAMDSIVAESET
ncbi:hypothetical protein Pr1d_03990 [Bythopirellula goksoeyrii]|uniref:Uncharacterized protein n=1 Tax=Bythopirellula goksoeyrii TaxID=1400387 RepID=A0A5B9Q2A6_9BACT|nr:hypothetical protein Pr1d_03990 [Bythopirellula goksoeyrii]